MAKSRYAKIKAMYESLDAEGRMAIGLMMAELARRRPATPPNTHSRVFSIHQPLILGDRRQSPRRSLR